MTWQDPGGDAEPGGASGPGDPALDETHSDPSTPPAAPGSAATPPQPPAPLGGPPPAWAPPPAAPGHSPTGYAPGSTPPGMTWAPPDTGYPSGPASGLRFADVLPRFVAWFIDILLLALVGAALSWIFSAVIIGSVDWSSVFATGGVGFDQGTAGRFVLVSFAAGVVGAVVDFVYFAFQWSSGARATLGMRLLRLQIGNAADGRTLTLPDAARRWFAMGTWLGLFSIVPLAGGLASLVQLAWYIVLLVTTSSHPARQGLHDRFAGTAVVQTGPAGNSLLVGCVVIAGILGLFVVFAMVALVFLGAQVSTILDQVGTSI